MKARIIGLFALFSLIACNQQNEITDPESELISTIENGLKPGIMINGTEYPGWSVQERMINYHVPGVSIAFFENNEIKWIRTYGYLDSDSTRPVDENTRFQAASISKPVAASGMMKLVETGKLDLDVDVNQYLTDWHLPENTFNPDEPVTLRRIVTHNAGLTVNGFLGYARDQELPSTLQILKGEAPANSAPVLADTVPGAIWRYSGGGYTLMQYVLENQLDDSFPDFMQKTVLDPAGMNRSTYQQPLPENMYENTAIGHRPDGSPVEGNWHTYPEMAAAGLWTTPSDLARWAMAVQRAYNNDESEFIQPQTARNILTKHKGDWGLGPALGGQGDSLYFRHGGANEGYRCRLFAQAKEGGQGLVIMTNGDLGGALISEIVRSVDAAYGWNIYVPDKRSVIELTIDELQSYTGKYRAGEEIEIDIYIEDGGLKGKVGMNIFDLYPEAKGILFDSQDGQRLIFTKSDSLADGFQVDGYEFKRVKQTSGM